jgi:hypothetical protein
MSKVRLATIAVAALVASTVSAAAFGDKCYPPLSAKGDKEHDMRSAMHSAKGKWEKAAHKKYGDHFDHWNYSGDRSVSCKWDAAGSHFSCTATARPCGRDHH